jgi:hypothetical protein
MKGKGEIGGAENGSPSDVRGGSVRGLLPLEHEDHVAHPRAPQGVVADALQGRVPHAQRLLRVVVLLQSGVDHLL